MNEVSSEPIRKFLLQNECASSTEIATRFKISKPTAIRILNELKAIPIGNARSRVYVLPRPVNNLGSNWTLYNVDENANISTIGTLHSTSAGFYLQSNGKYTSLLGEKFANGIFSALPWFLYDHRPQGFIGRNIVYNLNKQLGISKELNKWSDAEILEYFVRFGKDLSGSIIVGDRARELFLQGDNRYILESDRISEYPKFAEDAISNGEPRSAAAGEQPKFCTTIKSGETFRNVLVKFSGDLSTSSARRWGDLLVCEYIALLVLAKYGFSTPKAELVFAGNRIFLEYERIDRCGKFGRLSTCSLSSIDSAFIGAGGGSWASAMKMSPQYFRAEDISTVQDLYDFGLTIGNTDMHFGNLSFFVDSTLPFRLAPVYDMLPMAFAPKSDASMRNTPLERIAPTQKIAKMTTEFWDLVCKNPNISKSFKDIFNSSHR